MGLPQALPGANGLHLDTLELSDGPHSSWHIFTALSCLISGNLSLSPVL